MRIVVLAGYAPSLINFRGPLLRALVTEGYEVIACAPGRHEATENTVRGLGAVYEPLILHRTGMNPVADLQGIIHLCGLLRRLRPDLLLSYTIKPVIYGPLAAWLAGVPQICSIITGLGYSFTTVSPLNRIVRWMYRLALKRNELVFFQNRDDEAEFRTLGILSGGGGATEGPNFEAKLAKPRTVVVSGSGVDLEHFAAMPLQGQRSVRTHADTDLEGAAAAERTPASACGLNFLLIARLLRDKGTVEFAEAAQSLKTKYPKCRFQLLGPYDPNPAALHPEEVKAWVDEGSVEYLGEAEDVRPSLQNCDVYVLPSYREGTPRTVLEAMAVGRAIITTDAPGCRETIRKANGFRAGDTGVALSRTATVSSSVMRGENGFLVPVRDAQSLASAMEQFILDPTLCIEMGCASRDYAETRFDVHKVNAVILAELSSLRGDLKWEV